MDAFGEIVKAIESHGELPTHQYYHFEPWDVDRRENSVRKKMEEDGVDLYSGEMARHIGLDPHPFQTGYLLSEDRLRVVLGASQIGKSIGAKYEAIMMATGEMPICFRYEKGVVTPVKRKVTPENIRRWGRRDSKTGQLLDFDVDAPSPQSWSEWDCGNIVGVGMYPSAKIAPPGSQIWIGTFAKAKETYWWPDLAEEGTRIIPPHMVDATMGNRGVNKQLDRIYLMRNVMINFLTYEMGHKRFEAKMAWSLILDEEPPDREIFTSGLKHCQWMSQVFTPLHGVTWSKRVFFPDNRKGNCTIFHATAYDSPYIDKQKLEQERGLMEAWHRQSRIWGLFAESKGEPFFDRKILNEWISVAPKNYSLCVLGSDKEYNGWERQPYSPQMPGLLECGIIQTQVEEQNMQDVWKIYEEPEEGVGYITCVDPSEGAETPEEAGDFCQCFIMRPPRHKEKRPVIAAALRSTLPVMAFARVVALGMRYYNNAKLAAETKRGWANGAFAEQFRTLPDFLWIKYASVNDKTKTPKEGRGFDMNVNTRPVIFEMIDDYINGCEEGEIGITDQDLLKELAAAIIAVKNGKRRCDHPKTGTLDAGVAFGIGLYVCKNFLDQITCNVIAVQDKKEKSWFERLGVVKPSIKHGLAAEVPNTGR